MVHKSLPKIGTADHKQQISEPLIGKCISKKSLSPKEDIGRKQKIFVSVPKKLLKKVERLSPPNQTAKSNESANENLLHTHHPE